MIQELEKSNNKDVCSMCNKRKDYGIWITSKKKYKYYCKGCYIKLIEEEEDAKNGKEVDK